MQAGLFGITPATGMSRVASPMRICHTPSVGNCARIAVTLKISDSRQNNKVSLASSTLRISL